MTNVPRSPGTAGRPGVPQEGETTAVITGQTAGTERIVAGADGSPSPEAALAWAVGSGS